jgi:3'-phosphoadenosine 5'-phosphosulfate (PAPS) 3'-phosphatase
MNMKLEEEIKREVRVFVEGLNGRYRAHCSDEFLSALIMSQLNSEYPHNDVVVREESSHTVIEEMLQDNIGAAYYAVCWIFESILEHKCNAGGNGHHVARSFLTAMEKFLEKRKIQP